MPALSDLSELGERALVLSIGVSLPVVAAAAAVGIVVAALQAATQLQDATIAHLPRLLAVALVLIVVMPWMGGEIAAFARDAFVAR
jgi:type III secretory pathway component EscS